MKNDTQPQSGPSRAGQQIATPEVTLRVVLIGDPGAGKEALTAKLSNDPSYSRSANTAHKDIEHDGTSMRLIFGDLTEAERRSGKRPHCLLVCYDINNQKSFDNITAHLREIERYSIVGNHRILVATNSDMRHARQVSIDEGKALAEDLKIPYFEASANAAEPLTPALEQAIIEGTKPSWEHSISQNAAAPSSSRAADAFQDFTTSASRFFTQLGNSISKSLTKKPPASSTPAPTPPEESDYDFRLEVGIMGDNGATPSQPQDVQRGGYTTRLFLKNISGSSNRIDAAPRYPKCMLLCYDVTDPQSLKDLQNDLKTLERFGKKDTIKILVATNSDAPKENHRVSRQEGKDFADNLGLPHIAISARENISNCDALKQLVVSTVLDPTIDQMGSKQDSSRMQKP